MNISLFTAGLILLLTVHSSTQQRQSVSRNEHLKRALERGILNKLHHLNNMGVKLSKEDFELTFKLIVTIEVIKNAELFKDLKENDITKIINDSIKSRKVLKAAQALIADEEIAPRVVGATIMGAAQLAADFVKMMLTRY